MKRALTVQFHLIFTEVMLLTGLNAMPAVCVCITVPQIIFILRMVLSTVSAQDVVSAVKSVIHGLMVRSILMKNRLISSIQ